LPHKSTVISKKHIVKYNSIIIINDGGIDTSMITSSAKLIAIIFLVVVFIFIATPFDLLLLSGVGLVCLVGAMVLFGSFFIVLLFSDFVTPWVCLFRVILVSIGMLILLDIPQFTPYALYCSMGILIIYGIAVIGKRVKKKVRKAIS